MPDIGSLIRKIDVKISEISEGKLIDDRSKISQNVNFLEFHYHFWNHLVIRIQISPNKPDIGSLIRKIDVKISEISEGKLIDDRSKISQNVNFLEFHYHFWNHLVIRIQISPNKPDIGSLIRKIDVQISEI